MRISKMKHCSYMISWKGSKAYYDWLKRLAESVQTGEIFKFIPIETK